MKQPNSSNEFEKKYLSLYPQRWPALREAMAQPVQHVARINAFSTAENGLMSQYLMDGASIVAARILPIQPGDSVLDLCAAPGGKALILAEKLFATPHASSELVLNEPSPARRKKLSVVAAEYLPPEILKQIRITSYHGERWGLYEQNRYDHILIDAPCSSERHLLHSPSHLNQWTRNRTRALSHKQFALLAAGLAAVKPGGHILYSTCSISPSENDGVIRKLHHKRESQFECIKLSLELGEETEYGIQIFPDQTGWGPLYVSLIRKKTGLI